MICVHVALQTLTEAPATSQQQDLFAAFEDTPTPAPPPPQQPQKVRYYFKQCFCDGFTLVWKLFVYVQA